MYFTDLGWLRLTKDAIRSPKPSSAKGMHINTATVVIGFIAHTERINYGIYTHVSETSCLATTITQKLTFQCLQFLCCLLLSEIMSQEFGKRAVAIE